MKKSDYELFEGFMKNCMTDSAHDTEHIYRVLYNALDIAAFEESVDYNVLICACLLHDIGRAEQLDDPSLDHARIGAEKARGFLTRNGFDAGFINAVCGCIASHRFRGDNAPETVEARILFDADKLDVSGALGIARTLMFAGSTDCPLYTLNTDGSISDGTGDEADSFFREYRFKLEKLYSKFFTKRGEELARLRQKAAMEFYEALLMETRAPRQKGRMTLEKLLNQ